MTLPVFPSYPGILWPVKRSPAGSTVRHEAISGKRTAQSLRSVPRWSWEIGYEFLRSAYAQGSFTELEDLTGFWLSAVIGATAFAYNDDEDFAAAAQPFGAGDGTSTSFRLTRARGGFVEPVYIASVVNISVGGVPNTGYSVSNGVVTFTAAPANGALLVWNGSFSWMCRFDDDSLDLSRFMVGYTEAKSLKFSSEIAP